MNAVRAFIAIELPQVTLDALAEVQTRLTHQVPADSLRWVKPANIHLTLKFLGQVPTVQIATISVALKHAVSGAHGFPFEVMKAGCFPNLRRPRVVWIGVDEPTGALVAVQRSIESAIAPLGYPGEPHAFQPHLTLGRTARDVKPVDLHKIGDAVQSAKIGLLGHVHADSVVLFQSDLASGGSIYTALTRVPLAR